MFEVWFLVFCKTGKKLSDTKDFRSIFICLSLFREKKSKLQTSYIGAILGKFLNFERPELLRSPLNYSNPNQFCATAVNSTTVVFFIVGKIGITNVVIYDFESKIWKILSRNLLVPCKFPPCWGPCSCVTYQDKSYRR